MIGVIPTAAVFDAHRRSRAVISDIERIVEILGDLDRAVETFSYLHGVDDFLRDLARARIAARHIARTSIHARAWSNAVDLACALSDASARASALSGASDLALILARACAGANGLVDDLGGNLTRVADARKQRRTSLPARSAAGLVSAAARLLPAADRARYGDEYQSELWDLAQFGASRLQQLKYALRQLLRAFSMGRTLRSPRRRSAVP